MLLTDEILGFLDQSRISTTNIRRLAKIEAEATDDVAELASLVRRIAQVHPGKRRRWKALRQQAPDLFRLAAGAGLPEDLEPEQLGDDADPVVEEEWWGRWIEPALWEFEPTHEELLAASENVSQLLKAEPQHLFTDASD